MPTAFKCGGSVRPCIIDVEEVNEAAETGTAAHKCFESLASKGEIEWENIDNVCDDLEGNSEEVRFLCAKASRMWKTLRDTFPCALTEIAVKYELPALELDKSGITLTGHADLVSVVGLQIRILDWKTGRKDANYSHQLKAYLAMMLLAYPQLESGTATIAWVRTEEIENYTMTREDALKWVADFEQRVILWDGVYRTGPHCAHCRRKHECNAGNELMRTYVSAVRNVGLSDVGAVVTALTDSDCVELYQRARIVSQIANKALEAIKERASKQGEIVGAESKIYLDCEKPRELDPEKAWGVLSMNGFDDSDFAKCIKMSISKVEKRCAEKAPKGKGAAAKRDIAQKLELAGAITLGERYVLTERRK